MGFFEDNYAEDFKSVNTSDYIKWEYECVDIRTLTLNTKKLSELGRNGWELCACSDIEKVSVFKRKIKE